MKYVWQLFFVQIHHQKIDNSPPFTSIHNKAMETTLQTSIMLTTELGTIEIDHQDARNDILIVEQNNPSSPQGEEQRPTNTILFAIKHGLIGGTNGIPNAYFLAITILLCVETNMYSQHPTNFYSYAIILSMRTLSILLEMKYVKNATHQRSIALTHEFCNNHLTFLETNRFIRVTCGYIIVCIMLQNGFSTKTFTDCFNIITFVTVIVFYTMELIFSNKYAKYVLSKAKIAYLWVLIFGVTMFGFGQQSNHAQTKNTTTAVIITIIFGLTCIEEIFRFIAQLVLALRIQQRDNVENDAYVTETQQTEVHSVYNMPNVIIILVFSGIAQFVGTIWAIVEYGSFSKKSCEDLSPAMCLSCRIVALYGITFIGGVIMLIVIVALYLCVKSMITNRTRLRNMHESLARLDNGFLSQYIPKPDEECSICMDIEPEWTNGVAPWVTTKCGHKFCKKCVKKILEKTKECPTCKQDMFDGHDLAKHMESEEDVEKGLVVNTDAEQKEV